MFSHLWSCHSKSQRKANQTCTELVVPVASESRCGHTKRQPSSPSCQRMLANGGICLSWDRMIPLLLAVIPHNYYLSKVQLQFCFSQFKKVSKNPTVLCGIGIVTTLAISAYITDMKSLTQPNVIPGSKTLTIPSTVRRKQKRRQAPSDRPTMMGRGPNEFKKSECHPTHARPSSYRFPKAKVGDHVECGRCCFTATWIWWAASLSKLEGMHVARDSSSPGLCKVSLCGVSADVISKLYMALVRGVAWAFPWITQDVDCQDFFDSSNNCLRSLSANLLGSAFRMTWPGAKDLSSSSETALSRDPPCRIVTGCSGSLRSCHKGHWDFEASCFSQEVARDVLAISDTPKNGLGNNMQDFFVKSPRSNLAAANEDLRRKFVGP